MIAPFFISFALAIVISKLIIHLLGGRLLDIPNHRSSHTTPTPRGGGIAIVAGTSGAVFFTYLSGQTPGEILLFLVPGVIMAIIGVLDDFIDLNIRIRLSCQLITATLITGTILSYTNHSPLITLLLGISSIIGIVWLTNLYNFMDGINGLAGLQTIFICASINLLFYLQDTHTEVMLVMALLGFASLGFLYWNFPTAKLFMGDAGSLFIGITLATLMVWTGRENLATSCSWLILMAAFVADATYTLLVRAISGQKFYLPHRSHFYQKLAAQRKSHTQATLFIMSFNVCWLLPLAIAVQLGSLNEFLGLCLAYIPAIYCAYSIKAGKTEQ